MIVKRLILICIMCLCNMSYASELFELDENFSKISVTGNLLTLKETHSDSPDKIIHSIRFNRSVYSESVAPGPAAFWHKLEFKNTSRAPLAVNTVIETHHLRYLDLFLYQDNTLIKSKALGAMNQSVTDQIYQGPTFRFTIQPDESLTLLIRKENEGSKILPISFYNDERFQQSLYLKYLFWGAAIALLIALALYNVFVYSLNPGNSYFWYFIFQALVFVYFSGLHGFGNLFWPEGFQRLIVQNFMPMNILLIWVIFQFAKVFLRTQVNAPRLHEYIRYINYLTPPAIALTIWLPEYMTITPFAIYQVIVSLFGISLAVFAFKNQYRPARYFLIAWLIVVIGAAITTAAFIDLVEATRLTLHAFFIGALIELMLLSVALADRLRYAEKKAINKAYIDPQRKLPNYSFFINEFPSQLARLKQDGKALAMVIAHTKNYQELIGLLGPNILEPIYREHVARLSKILLSTSWAVPFETSSGEKEHFITLPGDQILFLVEANDDLEDILNTLVQRTNQPIMIKNFEVALDIKFGAAMLDPKKLSALECYRKVQIALLNCNSQNVEYNVYTDQQDVSLKAHGSMLRDIKKAIAQQQFNIMIQPQFDLFTQQLIGGEVLVRWEHHARGLVSPSEFVLVAEQTGIISKITHQIIDHAFHWLSIQTSLPDGFLLAVNLSAQDLYDDNLIVYIEQQMAVYELHPHNVAFEITESSMMKNAEKSLATISQLQSMGFSIAIDDFGTGYSSLSYLQKIHADKIKIDLSFIRNIHHKSTNKAITETISKLAKSIRAKTVAEGIESADELLVIKQLECDYGQGKFWSEPLDPDAFSRRYNTQCSTEIPKHFVE